MILVCSTVAATVLLPTSAYSLTGSMKLSLQAPLGRKGQVIVSPVKGHLHGYSRSAPMLGLRRGSLDLITSVTSYINSLGLPMGVSMKQISGGSFGVTAPRSQSFNFYFQGHRLCGISFKATTSRRGEAVINGQLPEIQTVQSFGVDDWPEQHHASHRAIDRISETLGAVASSTTHSMERCLFVHSDGSLSPAWETIVAVNDLPYLAYVGNHEVFAWQQRFFGAVGRTKVYKKNPVDGEFGFVTIGNLIGDGTLSSETFSIDPGISVARANSCNHEFLFEPTDQQFAEASAITHSTRMLAWYNDKFNYQWGDQEPMLIKLREIINDDVNNALYVPAVNATSQPRVLIGEGDGVVLKNLMVDADVVSHEFGHHIVFRSIQSIEGESLVLHEGLADFFTFARTGDPCLGESICPAGSAICWEDAKCLRTGDNDLTLDNAPEAPHLKSQFISGMLWDLYEDDKYDANQLTVAVYKAIDYMSETSSYEEFITSLIQADKDVSDGKHCALIKENAEKRGLSEFVADVNCGASSLTATNDGASITEEAQEQTETGYILAINDDVASATIELTDACDAVSRKKSKSSGLDLDCGAIPGAPIGGSPIWLLALLGSPLFGFWLRRFRS